MNDAPTLHSSANEVLSQLRDRFPDTPFLALGQTALWDEPTKATLRIALDTLWPEARMIAAAHDTDYFAKLPGHPASAGDAKYALVPHDDARTRGLWSAAGEMSRLFGSEDVATRAALEEAGVSLQKALSTSATDPLDTLSELTAAWGWTGLIYTRWDRKVARDVPLGEILPTLLEQITWAVEGSAENLTGASAKRASTVATTIRGWVTGFAKQNPDASLTELYRDLFPRFYELLLGSPPSNLATSSTTRLLRFNRETAGLPRFAFLDLFLNPITRRIAIDAYNLAVGGSGTYTLEEFGPGAIPFDLVIPSRGRGTICIPGDGTIFVNTPREPIILCDNNCDFASVESLANIVERELGPEVAIVGKAVALLPMLAAEFTLVFHEGASGYSDRTRQMMDRIAQRNITFPTLRPILRVRYSTWSALEALPSDPDGFVLPEFLAQAFGREKMEFCDFGDCWGRAIEWEKKRLADIKELLSPRDLLDYLSRSAGSDWSPKAKEYQAANLKLLKLWDQAQAIQGRVYTIYDQVRRLKSEADALERAKGNDFRKRIQPLRDRMTTNPAEIAALQSQIDALQAERQEHFDLEIASRRSQVKYAMETVRDLRARRLAVERGPEATEARRTLRRIEAEAELAKARLVRNAHQAIHGMEHTNYRPSSWWFPIVDASGAWFRRLAQTTEYYLEPLSSHG